MKQATRSIALFLFALLIAGCSATKPPSELKLDNVLRATVDEQFMQGKEVIVSVLELPPNTPLNRHWHPGEEYIYFLEGSGEIRFAGEPTVQCEPGKAYRIPYRKMHQGVAGPDGAKLVVFRLHEAGEPERFSPQ